MIALGRPPLSERIPLQVIAAFIALHVILPAAIVVMVSAFLFYLIDLRAVVLPGGERLKQIGFCFAVATVMIARYGKVYVNRARQTFYTLALAGATVFAMAYRAESFLDVALSGLIIAGVWRFATGVTNRLHLDPEDETEVEAVRLYGVERIRMEQHRTRETGPARHNGGGDTADPHGNPAASVARLAVVGVVAIALGEPIILGADPSVGSSALMAVMAFLLSTGVVLAAGSSVGMYRKALRAGSSPPAGVVPAKMALAALLMAAMLGLALMAPGIRYEGSGRLRPVPHGTEEAKDGKGARQEHPGDELRRAKPGRGPSEARRSLLERVAMRTDALRKLLMPVVVFTLLAAALYLLVQLAPFLKGWKTTVAGRLRSLLGSLKNLLSLPRVRARNRKARPSFIDIETLRPLPPREAVLRAYEALLTLLSDAGHDRPPRLTPYEYLHTLPDHLAFLSTPAQTLTDLYVAAAYGTAPPSPGEQEAALQAVTTLQTLLRTTQAASP